MKLNLLEITVVMMIVGVLLGLTLTGGDRDYKHRYPPPGPNPGHPFAAIAGEYHQGARLGRNWNLSLLPDGRYSFIWSGCMGVYERESGVVKRSDGYLALSPVKPIEPPMERIFLPLKWGRRSYLIPVDRLQSFCDAITGGDEPRNEFAGEYYLIGVDVPVTGLPELPEQWATYLRENLVMGTIVEVTGGGRARVDVGSTDGLQVGSLLTVQGHSDRAKRQLNVVSVKQGSCEVEEAYPGLFETPIETDWKVVTAREPRLEPAP